MKFPILIKKGRIFLWYSDHWINITLIATCNGGGIKGYYRFFKGLLKCIASQHSYINVYRIISHSSRIQCSYCNKEKE
jgi:hypothetical protein